MLRTAVKIARPIRVLQNTKHNGVKWGQIKDMKTGQILHTGQLPYIKRIAAKRYNQSVEFTN